MSFNFKDYIKGEHEMEGQVAGQFAEEFGLCEEIWNFLHNDLISSVDRQVPLLMSFKQQVDIGFFGAITSLLRMHGAFHSQNLRFALENMAITIYHLVHPEEFNNLFSETTDEKDEGKFAKKARLKGYKLLEEKFPHLNKTFESSKTLTNSWGAHATFMTTVSNYKHGERKGEVNLFDTVSSFSVASRLLHVADLMIAFIQVIVFERFDEKMLPLKEGAEEKYIEFVNRFKILHARCLAERRRVG